MLLEILPFVHSIKLCFIHIHSCKIAQAVHVAT